MAKDEFKGRVLDVTHQSNGLTHVKIDNGATDILHLLVPSITYQQFALQDSREIHELLTNPAPGARNKPKHQGKGARNVPGVRRKPAARRTT